jgi:hypothetical protein
MGLFDRIFGSAPRQPAAAPSDDEQAIARYRYMLRTAPPEAIEQAHTEAFARLTPEQRRRCWERARQASGIRHRHTDPHELARYATRTEIRQPGTLERTFGAMPAAGGLGFGGLIAGSLLGSMAGTVLGTAIAQEFLGHHQGMDLGGFDHPQVDLPRAPDALPDPSFHDAVDGGAFDIGGDTFDV